MRSSWKILAAVAAGLIVAPQFAAADDVNEQLKQMQERMSQLENRLQATTDQLEVTSERAAEQQQMLEQAGVAEAKGSQSGLASFFDSIEFGGYVDATYNYNINHLNAGSNRCPAGLHGPAGRQWSLLRSTRTPRASTSKRSSSRWSGPSVSRTGAASGRTSSSGRPRGS